MRTLLKRSSSCLLLLSLAAVTSTAQEAAQESKEPFQQQVDVFELQNETIFEAIGRLNQIVDVAFAVEGVLASGETSQKPEPVRVTARKSNATVAQLLDWFCELDPRYAWQRDGNIANFFPRARRADTDYVMNLRLAILTFANVLDAEKGVFAVDRQLGDRSPHFIFLQVGGSVSFAEPWTAAFYDISVRHAFNRIAQQLGTTYGWQIGGTLERPIVMFHQRLGVRRQLRR